MYPRGFSSLNKLTSIVNFKCFAKLKVDHYFKVLYEGECLHGRFIYLEEINEKMAKLTFIRFLNQVTISKSIPVGFQIFDEKEKLFAILL